MNCCNENHSDSHNGHGRHGRMGHLWMMALCCGAPILLLAVLPLLGTGFPGIQAALSGVLPLLCPVLMIAMIPMMLRRDKGEQARNCRSQQEEIEAIPDDTVS